MTIKRPMFPPTPADPDHLYVKTDIAPETVFKAIGQLRREAQDEIDRLLTFLNATDGYSTTELEATADDDEDGGDDEPSLGSIENHPHEWSYRSQENQDNWAKSGDDDRELADDTEEDDIHDGREPDVDDEPSLGSFDRLVNQELSWGQRVPAGKWWLATNEDVELAAEC